MTKTRTLLGTLALIIALILFGVGALTATVINTLKGYRYNPSYKRREKK